MLLFIPRLTCLLALALLFAGVWPASAQRWDSQDLHLGMEVPVEWRAFEPSLLEAANKQVRHITGGRFIEGYALSITAGTSLVFPYLLIQYEPYAELPEAGRPVAKLDTHGKLVLLTRVVDAMRTAQPLAESIDVQAFAQANDSEVLRLVDLTDDGRFDLAGTIRPKPGSDDFDPIHYHTHGVMGQAGVAMVTVFGSEEFESLKPVIAGPLRTLGFAEGYAYADLPDAPPTPADPQTTDGTTPGTGVPDASDTSDTSDPTDADPVKPAEPETQTPEPVKDPTDPGTRAATQDADAPDGQADGGALVIVLVVMGLVMLGVVGVVVFVTHQQAQARRERARARRERLEHRG